MGDKRRPVIAIILVALIVRVLVALLYSGAIDTEGQEYARIAQNLIGGNGYRGLATPGVELFFPPLFPAMIAAVSLVTKDAHTAGMVVSILMGALLTAPVFLLTRSLYGSRAGYIAAWLIALHPYLVYYSVTVHCEPTYFTLFFSGVYCVIRAMREPSRTVFLLGGVFFGLAYLVRPEALIVSFVAYAVVVISGRLTDVKRAGSLAGWALCMPAISLALAAPYIVWMHSHTGTWRLEGKIPLNYVTRDRMLKGAASQEASFAIDGDLKEQGVWIQPNKAVIETFKPTVQEFRRYIGPQFTQVINSVADTMTGLREYGAPPLFVLAILGLFRRPWRLQDTMGQLFLLVVLGLACVGLFFIYYYDARFMIAFLVIQIMWSAEGVIAIERWVFGTVKSVFSGNGRLLWLNAGVTSAAIASILLASLVGVRGEVVRMKQTRAYKEAGEWLRRQDPSAKNVMDWSTLAFHAGAELVWFPYTSSENALRYLDKRKVDYIVVSNFYRPEDHPYLMEWLTRGVPSPRAEVIYHVEEPSSITIYKWNPTTEATEGSR